MLASKSCLSWFGTTWERPRFVDLQDIGVFRELRKMAGTEAKAVPILDSIPRGPGSFIRSNKKHKLRPRTRGEIANAVLGRVESRWRSVSNNRVRGGLRPLRPLPQMDVVIAVSARYYFPSPTQYFGDSWASFRNPDWVCEFCGETHLF